MIPPDTATAVDVPDIVGLAGSTGVLHTLTPNNGARTVLWTRYADGATTTIDGLDFLSLGRFKPAGGDSVWATIPVPGHSSATTIAVLDVATMSWQEWPKPTDGIFRAIYGNAMIVSPTTGGAPILHRFAPDGSFVTVPVTGMPDGGAAYPLAGDASAAVLQITDVNGTHFGLLDLASAAVAPFPADETGSGATVLMTRDRVGFVRLQSNLTNIVRTYDRAGVATGSGAVARTVTLPANVGGGVGLVGDRVVASSGQGATPTTVIDYTAPGTPVIVAMVQASGQHVVQGPDGAVVVGGAGAGDLAVRRLTTGPDGAVAQTVLFAETGPMTNGGVTITRGLVQHIESYQLIGRPAVYQLFNHQIAPDAPFPAGRTVYPDGGRLTNPIPCQAGARCTRAVGMNGSDAGYLAGGTGSIAYWSQFAANASRFSTTLPTASGTIVDASDGYAIVNGTDPATQYVFAPGNSNIPLRSRPITGAALAWGTLWTGVSGAIQASKADTGAVTSTIALGALCSPSDLRATLGYVYWSCGSDGPAGVYDLTRRVNISVPADQYLLGDGYLVRHDANGDLLRYDLTGGTLGDPVRVATFDRGSLTDDRGITWAVDKYSDQIAWVDADDAVHVVTSGVPASPVTSTVSHGTYGDAVVFGTNGAWYANVNLTRPIASWSLTVTQASTGKVVATQTGGPSRLSFGASWDGYLASKAKAASGRYRYVVTATATGEPARTVASGTLTVHCGTPNFHSYDCDGLPDVLGVLRNGEGHWLIVDGGKIRDNGYTESFIMGTGSASLTSAIVPFGDLNGDGDNDLLVRNGSGVLTAYLGIGQPYFNGVASRRIGGGWNIYKQLVSTGDLTGDGIPDLLAQDTAGKLWRYNGTKAGLFAARVAVAGSYAYPRLIGPGDWNGDGKADLMMINASLSLYVAYGTGKGTFGTPIRIGSSWAKTTRVIGAGDLNQDGRNDLAVRDGLGTFWMYPGNGRGGFGTRKQLATGYQKYAGMF